MTKIINDKLIHLGGIRLLAIIINPAMDIHVQVLFLFLLGIYLEVELLGQMVTLFDFLRNAKLFSTAVAPLNILTSNILGLNFSML